MTVSNTYSASSKLFDFICSIISTNSYTACSANDTGQERSAWIGEEIKVSMVTLEHL